MIETEYGNTTVGTYDESLGGYSVYDYMQNLLLVGGADINNPEFDAWVQANAEPADLIYKSYAYAYKQTADAIRSKGGTSAPIEWDYKGGFAPAVNAIVIGKDGTATANDIASGVVAYSQNKRLVGTMADANGVSF